MHGPSAPWIFGGAFAMVSASYLFRNSLTNFIEENMTSHSETLKTRNEYAAEDLYRAKLKVDQLKWFSNGSLPYGWWRHYNKLGVPREETDQQPIRGTYEEHNANTQRRDLYAGLLDNPVINKKTNSESKTE
eukprot:gb/GECH01012758.1/.p1 GENE.gb/GECH01012758.1/~~gb/GECH01012758.1/.p1  ORF type:complete len:132 (+),score=26.07 gb/GECH01012758.1/:1-396(+)